MSGSAPEDVTPITGGTTAAPTSRGAISLSEATPSFSHALVR